MKWLEQIRWSEIPVLSLLTLIYNDRLFFCSCCWDILYFTLTFGIQKNFIPVPNLFTHPNIPQALTILTKNQSILTGKKFMPVTDLLTSDKPSSNTQEKTKQHPRLGLSLILMGKLSWLIHLKLLYKKQNVLNNDNPEHF
jgi:hypothetical protein